MGYTGSYFICIEVLLLGHQHLHRIVLYQRLGIPVVNIIGPYSCVAAIMNYIEHDLPAGNVIVAIARWRIGLDMECIVRTIYDTLHAYKAGIVVQVANAYGGWGMSSIYLYLIGRTASHQIIIIATGYNFGNIPCAGKFCIPWRGAVCILVANRASAHAIAACTPIVADIIFASSRVKRRSFIIARRYVKHRHECQKCSYSG